MRIRAPIEMEGTIQKLFKDGYVFVNPVDARKIARYLSPIREEVIIAHDRRKRKSLIMLEKKIQAKLHRGLSKLYIYI